VNQETLILEIEPGNLIRREQAYSSYDSSTRVQMIQGQKLSLRKNDEYSKTLFIYRRQHISLLIALSRFNFRSLQPKSKVTCLDIGANLGYVSAYLAMRTDVDRVYAFEPNHETFEILKMNSLYYKKILPHQMLISQLLGIGFHLPHPTNSAHSKTGSGEVISNKSIEKNSVSKTTIDDFVDKNKLEIHFIKIDVEGHETEVLEGARKTVSSQAPLVLLEINGIREYRERLVSQVRSVFFSETPFVYQILGASQDGFLYPLKIDQLSSLQVGDVFLVPSKCEFRQ
jgi:FkbM family methyltransferase